MNRKHSWKKMYALFTVDDDQHRSTELADFQHFGETLVDDTHTPLVFVRVGRQCTKCHKEIRYPAFDNY